MAHRIRGLEEFLDFASTPAWRSAVFFAAVAFAFFHLIALVTPTLDLEGSADTLNPLQLLNLIATVARFAAPLGFLVKGLKDCQRLRVLTRSAAIPHASL
jgi:hypothetical protein